jgi:hypothetical protein
VMGVDPAPPPPPPPVPLLEDWLLDRSLMQDLIKQHLARAQERMKRQADKNRTKRSFDVGDLVYLKLQRMCNRLWLLVPTRSWLLSSLVRSRLRKRLEPWLINWHFHLHHPHTLFSMSLS